MRQRHSALLDIGQVYRIIRLHSQESFSYNGGGEELAFVMSGNFRVKPSKPVSVVAMIVGVAFVILGLVFAIPNMGIFGIIWTIVAAGVTLYHAYNVFTERGLSAYDVEFDSDDARHDDTDTRLRKLQKLRDDGLITEEEFQRKRLDIRQEDW